MQTGYIETLPDNQLTGSSFWSDGYAYARSRLHTETVGSNYGGWAATNNDIGQYIQADLGTVRRIEKVATQGSHSNPRWVSTYKFSYSVDGSTYNFIQNNAGSETIFTGNTDQNSVVENTFDTAVEARYVRVYPRTWRTHIVMRWEVYGCEFASKILCILPVSATCCKIVALDPYALGQK